MTQQLIEAIKPHPNVLIYGSGLSGLSAALKLARKNVCVDILQTSDDNLCPGYLNDLLNDPAMMDRLREEAVKNENISFNTPLFPHDTPANDTYAPPKRKQTSHADRKSGDSR